MTLRLNGSTSGYTEIDAPAVAGSNTLVLPTGNGSSGQYLQTNGSGALSWASVTGLPAQALTRATAVASTSGTSIDFTGIPSTVKRIMVMFSGVSTNGTSALMIQLGSSSGIESTGYTSSGQGFSPAGGVGASTSTAGMLLFDGAQAAFAYDGIYIISNMTGNTWISSGVMNRGNGGFTGFGAGNKGLSAILDRIRITTVNGTDTFDAGTINIMYEG